MADNEIKIIFKPEGHQSLIRAIQALDIHTKSLIGTQAGLQQNQRDSRNEMTKMLKSLRVTGMDFKKLGISVDVINKAYQGHTTSIDRVTIAYPRYNKWLKSTGITQNKVTGTYEKASRGLFDLGHSARQTGGAFSVLRSQLLLFQFAMTLGVRQLIRFTNEASRVESMERAFNTLAGGGDNATEALKKLKEATNNTMSSFDLFQQANNAMVLGVAKNSDEMAEMFDIAQRLGNALGRDTAQSVESLVTGIGRQSRLMLDNIGIIVKTGDAYSDYGKEIGKNADELTDLEKKQAFTNATMKQARLLTRLLAPEVGNTQMSFLQLRAASAELSIELGKSLQPSLKFIADLTKSLAESVDADDFRRLGRAVLSLAVTYGTYKTAVFLATIQTDRFTLALLRNPIALVAVALNTAMFALLEYSKATKKTTKNTIEQDVAIENLTNQASRLRAELKALINEEEAVNDVIERNNELRDSQIEKVNSATEGLYNELIALKLRNAELRGASKVQVRQAKDTAEGNKNQSNFQKQLLNLILKELALNETLTEEEKKKREIAKKADKDRREALKKKEEEEKAFQNFALKNEKATQEILKSLYGDTEEFKINQVENTAVEFLKLGVNRSLVEKFVANEIENIFKETEENKRKEIEKTARKFKQQYDEELRLENERIANNRRLVQEQANLQEELHKNNLEFQLLKIDLQAEELKQLEQSEMQKLAVVEFVEKAKKDAVIKNLEETDEFYNAFMGGYETFVNTMLDLDMSLDDKRKALMESMKRATIKFIADILVEQLKSVIAQQVIEKKAQASSILTAKATGKALSQAYSVSASYASTATFGGAAVAGLAASQASVTSHKAMATFEDGGLVGGKRHSEGGTIIEAERGEFVMSRSAVEAIGIETLNQLNQGQGTGITLNISAPLVDETVVDKIIPAIQKAQKAGLA